MASAVASPLERQFTTIAGLDEMTSSSAPGSTNVTLQFDLEPRHRRRGGRRADGDRGGDAAAAARHAGAAVLPQGQSRPTSRSSASGLTSNTLPLSELDDYAENVIAPRISMVDGVAQVNVFGAQKYAVRVQVDPDKLQAQQHRDQRSRPGAAELERQPADRAAVRPERDLQHQRRTAS